MDPNTITASGAGGAKGLDREHRTSHKYDYKSNLFLDNVQKERLEFETTPINGFTNTGQ